jgi:ribose 5-phosphate isomerase
MIKMPNINSVVEVTTRYRTNTFFADKNGYQYFTTKGKVIVAPKGSSADSFAIQSNRLAVINLGKVIDIKFLSGDSVDIQSYIVKGKGGQYQVIRNGQEYSCTCIGFKYHSKCKHITEIKESL